MRTSRLVAVATAIGLAVLLLPAVPASAISLDPGTLSAYTVTPTSAPAGSTVTVTSDRACTGLQSGETAGDVIVGIATPSAAADLGQSKATTRPDGTWTATLTIDATARNGKYMVLAVCLTKTLAPYDFFIGKTVLVTSPPGQLDPAVRLAGNDRIATSIAIAKDAVGGSGALGGLGGAVVLARSDSYADALAGTPLARSFDSPLLLTGPGPLEARTMAEIDAVLGGGGTVYVMGGTAAVGDDVVTTLTDAGYEVKRIAGLNRYDTAAKAAFELSRFGNTISKVFLATGTDFREGLVAGTAAAAQGHAALLLTNGSTMPPETQSYLDTHGATVYAVGADAAAADPKATAIVGSDVADTSRLVAEQFFTGAYCVGVASQLSFADALSGGVHAALNGAPLLLTDAGALPASVETYLQSKKTDLVLAYVYGGTAAVSDAVRDQISHDIS